MLRKRYSPNEINKLKKSLNSELPKDVINVINFIAHKVGAPSYKKTPNFKRQNRNVDKITGDDWAAIRNFKKTIINKNTEGILKNIDDIRCLLNKITNTSYDEIKTEIFKKIQESKDKFNLEEFTKIGKLIFTIGSKNKFCSHLYAKLYKELSKIYTIFNSISEQNYKMYGKIFDKINYVDPEEDYNLYCDYNKENENRKTMSLFFINLMKYNVFEREHIIELMSKLIHNIEQNINEDGKVEIVEETVSSLHIFITEGHEELCVSDSWEKIMMHIKKMSSINKKNYKSLTTKTVFKYLDLLEELED
tara:strand:- start:3109 stop:4026 length:918 start_codon:yes stop_codon:yes gene_type:complete